MCSRQLTTIHSIFSFDKHPLSLVIVIQFEGPFYKLYQSIFRIKTFLLIFYGIFGLVHGLEVGEPKLNHFELEPMVQFSVLAVPLNRTISSV
jgi:hypothetical protein